MPLDLDFDLMITEKEAERALRNAETATGNDSSRTGFPDHLAEFQLFETIGKQFFSTGAATIDQQGNRFAPDATKTLALAVS